ncbi:MAG: hypothetical protein VB824_00645 [Dehalococcoidia bacterium]
MRVVRLILTKISDSDGIETRMNKLTKAVLTLWLIGGAIFPLVVAFFAWQRGLGSTH